MTAHTKFARALQRTDPALYDLPHPKIAKLSDVIGLLNLIVGDSGVTILSDILKDLTKTKGVLIIAAAQVFPSIAKLKNFSHGDGKVYVPGLEGFLAPLRFFVNDGRIFEVETDLDRLLAWTDIGSSAPIDFFRMPFRVTYFHFGSNAGDLELTTENFESSPLLGAYVTELHLLESTPESKHFSRWAGPNGEITCYEITLVGRPIHNMVDHRAVFARVYVGPKMSGMTVTEVLDLNFQIIEAHGLAQVAEVQKAQLKAGVTHLAKVLLRLHADDSLQLENREESELAERIQRVGVKKLAKLERRMERAYDRIVLAYHRNHVPASPSGEFGHSMRAHWRRGHFRHQPFGPGRAQSKLLWIQPMLVGDLKEEDGPVKQYSVQIPRPKPKR